MAARGRAQLHLLTAVVLFLPAGCSHRGSSGAHPTATTAAGHPAPPGVAAFVGDWYTENGDLAISADGRVLLDYNTTVNCGGDTTPPCIATRPSDPSGWSVKVGLTITGVLSGVADARVTESSWAQIPIGTRFTFTLAPPGILSESTLASPGVDSASPRGRARWCDHAHAVQGDCGAPLAP